MTDDPNIEVDKLDELAVQVQAMIITPKQFREAILNLIRQEKIKELEELLTYGDLARFPKETIQDRIKELKEAK